MHFILILTAIATLTVDENNEKARNSVKDKINSLYEVRMGLGIEGKREVGSELLRDLKELETLTERLDILKKYAEVKQKLQNEQSKAVLKQKYETYYKVKTIANPENTAENNRALELKIAELGTLTPDQITAKASTVDRALELMKTQNERFVLTQQKSFKRLESNKLSLERFRLEKSAEGRKQITAARELTFARIDSAKSSRELRSISFKESLRHTVSAPPEVARKPAV